VLFFNLINREQKQIIYGKYGLSWEWVRDAVREVFSDKDRRKQLNDSTNIFRLLDQDPAACRHHHQSHPAALRGVGRHEGAGRRRRRDPRRGGGGRKP